MVTEIFFASSTIRTFRRTTSPTVRNLEVSPNSTFHGTSLTWRGAG